MNTIIGPTPVFPKVMIFALLGLLALQPDPVMAKIFKYKDENGKTHFTDDPSSIPLRYRKKDSMKKFKGVYEPPPPGASGRASADGDKKDGKEKGFSSQDVALIRKTIQVFKTGIALGEKYNGATPTFANGQGAVNAIQSTLPAKESLASELEGTTVPELKGALGFLKQSIAQDRDTASVGTGLKRRITAIFSRLASEGEQQASMIKKLEGALKEAKKKKEEAKKKKEEEAKRKAEEDKRKKEEEAKRKTEEEAGKEEESYNR